jgi:hypothetical protein
MQPRQLVDAPVINELRTRGDLGTEDRTAISDFTEPVIEERTSSFRKNGSPSKRSRRRSYPSVRRSSTKDSGGPGGV